MREVQMPSGAVLKVVAAPFADAKALYQALLEEAKGLKLDGDLDVQQTLKDLLVGAFASKKIEAALNVCMARCLYKHGEVELKIDKDTFEPLETREDYTYVCLEVATENVTPFVKSLYAAWSQTLRTIKNVRA